MTDAAAQQDSHTKAVARYGFFPVVAADEVEVSRGGVTAAFSAGDITFTQAGASAALVGGNLSISQGGSQFLAAGGDISVEMGGAVVMAARSIRVNQGFVGALVAADVTLEDTKVLLTTAQAAAVGAALGLTLLVAGKLLSSRS